MLTLQELHIRAAFLSSVRNFFQNKNFLEVDTPIRQPVIIPESNIEPITAEGSYLQTSPELCMKRILAAGCDRIFQICSCFRKDEVGRHHHEEFIMLEWYRKDATYFDLMNDCEELLEYILGQLSQYLPDLPASRKKSKIVLNKDTVAAARPWYRLTVQEAFERYSPVPLAIALREDTFDEILVEYIEPNLGKDIPLFLYDYPIELASLARKKRGDEGLSERFELYWNGLELANGFSELTNSQEQQRRFDDEIAKIELENRTSSGMPQRFLEALKSLDEAAGIALGLDRLFMLLLGKETLAEAVSFAMEDL